jgi:aerobic carbon-monoxide dehydrogenase large subunit
MSIVEECGRVLDRDLAVGQLVGGAVMGLGDALLEEHRYEHSWTGSKGVGEGETIGAVAAIGCSVSDALAPLGAMLNELPGTPQRLFRACGNAATPNSGVD